MNKWVLHEWSMVPALFSLTIRKIFVAIIEHEGLVSFLCVCVVHLESM